MRNKLGVFLWAAVFSFLTGCSIVTDGSNTTGSPALENQSSQVRLDDQSLDELDKQNVLSQEIISLENQVNQNQANQHQESQNIALETNVDFTGAETDDLENSKKKRMTLENILELSRKDSLDWTDFDDYEGEDVGFGLYILKYDIDDNFYLLVGGTGQGKPMYVRLVSTRDKNKYIEIGRQNGDPKANSQDKQTSSGELSANYTMSENLQENQESMYREKVVEEFIRENKGTSYYVSILAHIKEIKGDGLIISSDTDAFPGAFFVSNVRNVMADEEFWKLKGGINIRILMEDMKLENEKYNLSEFRAKEIVILSDDDDFAQEDILLISAPELELNDPLSSFYNPFCVSSGNYTWTVEDNGEEKQSSASGAHPLEESNFQKKLKLPRYATGHSMDYSANSTVHYLYSTKIQPDFFTVRQWNISDMNNHGAKEERITVYYGRVNFIELQRDKIYEFTAEWTKENFLQNKFYGTASYVIATE